MKKNAHIISHSHWDREWYMPFEYHRARLIKLMDDCMELFETDPDFKSFHLDGHTVLIEDYLEIKPQNREKIKKYIEEGKFVAGPWYVLQDEFLTSSEANVRNLLVGMNIAKDYGKVGVVGYFPDSFGNAGQMPQLMKQAGMKAIAFGRGVKPTGANNAIADGESYASQFSELYWQSPDGSKLPAILFANWYHNGWEIPANADSEYWDNVLHNVERFASTPELLLMNGCDHQPVQKDVSLAIKAANEKYPDYNFIHSTFEDYVNAMIEALPENLAVVEGELIGQDAGGWCNLEGTTSSHVNLKIMNKKGENLLENTAEPLSVIAAQLGKEYPHDMLLYAWKTLMKNHPHDSICGCSCDEVNDEMRTRFIKSRQAAETIVNEDLDYISKHIDTAGLQDCDAMFAVINTFGKERNEVVSVDVDLRRVPTSAWDMPYDQVNSSLYTGAFVLMDSRGAIIPCTVSAPRPRFGYVLPEDRFRQPYIAETVTVTFEACDVPAMGYRVYGLKKAEKTAATSSLVSEKNVMENPYLKVSINEDGTINVYDKENDRLFCNMMSFEDVSDIGNEYTFMPSPNDIPILSGTSPATIELLKDEPYMAEYKIITKMCIPVSTDKQGEAERTSGLMFSARKGGRSEETVLIPITSYVSLAQNSHSIKIRTEFTNTAKDHRLRVLFPNDISCTQHKAESIFEAVTRDNVHKPSWTYPSGCEHQQGFVMMQDEQSGLAIANIGLYEYEILPDNTIAVTLVRAVGDLGDWVILPTELAQVQMPLSCEYEITPFSNESDAFLELSAFQHTMQKIQVFESSKSTYQNNEFLWNGDCLKPCAFKIAQNSNDIILRWANYSNEEQLLTIAKTNWIDNLYMSNVVEEKGPTLVAQDGEWKITVKPFEIITVGCNKKN